MYTDDDYEKYDEDSEETDAMLSDMPTFSGSGTSNEQQSTGQKDALPKSVKEYDEHEWEDVEIDDFESEHPEASEDEEEWERD